MNIYLGNLSIEQIEQVSVSYVPKDFGNYHPCEKDFTKKFGWVNFTVLNPLEIRPK